jgi:hypothetical protein
LNGTEVDVGRTVSPQKSTNDLVETLHGSRITPCPLPKPEVVPRFYFHLRSRENHIPDDSGKELDNLNDAYAHARQLIDKILFHVGHDDTDLWKVVISNDEHDAQMIVPFAVSHAVRGQPRGTT